MKRTPEEKLLNPKPGSKIAAAQEFGIDLTLLVENLRLTPDQRIRNLQSAMVGFDELIRASKQSRKRAMIELKPVLKSLTGNAVEFVIIGGVAISAHGSAYLTQDLDFCYSRDRENLKRIVASLSPFKPRPRGFPANLPYLFNETTLRNGTNFTFRTDIGDVDLLGEVAGVGTFDAVDKESEIKNLLGFEVKILNINALIKAKRAAGRTKDLLVLPELEALLEALGDEE